MCGGRGLAQAPGSCGNSPDMWLASQFMQEGVFPGALTGSVKDVDFNATVWVQFDAACRIRWQLQNCIISWNCTASNLMIQWSRFSSNFGLAGF